MKKFLYLVQSRYEDAEKHLPLKSPDADVLIYTFDKPVNRDGFIYKPNTSWAEGRNILIEAAKKIKYQYKYYIFLDDDIAFVKGSFKEFESEVLKLSPDFCTPFYCKPHTLKAQKIQRRSLFSYTDFKHFDSCFICMTKELFFDSEFMNYDISIENIPIYHRSHASCIGFWSNLFTNYQDIKAICISTIWHTNLNSIAIYNLNYRCSVAMVRLHGKNANITNPLYSKLRYQKLFSRVTDITYRLRQFKKTRDRIRNSGLKFMNLSDKKRFRYYLKYRAYKQTHGYLIWREEIATHFLWLYFVFLIRDIKLNFIIWLGK